MARENDTPSIPATLSYFGKTGAGSTIRSTLPKPKVASLMSCSIGAGSSAFRQMRCGTLVPVTSTVSQICFGLCFFTFTGSSGGGCTAYGASAIIIAARINMLISDPLFSRTMGADQLTVVNKGSCLIIGFSAFRPVL